MAERALESIKFWHGRPLPFVQQAASIDENVAVTFEYCFIGTTRRRDLEDQMPEALSFIPLCTYQLVLITNVFKEVVFFSNRFEVSMDLNRPNVAIESLVNLAAT